MLVPRIPRIIRTRVPTTSLGVPDQQPGTALPQMRPGPSGDIELTILMPCLNEAKTVGTCIRKAWSFVERHGVLAEVVIADNGSTDGSRELASALGARVVDVPVRGYGAAIYHGSRSAHGRYVIVGDADDSYDFVELSAFLDKLRQGSDFVIGNRFAGGIRPGAMPWKNRYVGNPLLSGLGRHLFGTPVRDLHCGLRGYSVDAFQRMDLRTTGMEFASEMVIKATLLGMDIAEVPTTLSPDGRGRAPHLRPFRDGWRHLRFMLLYSPRWLFLYPGLALALVGATLMIWLLPHGRTVFGVGLDVHTLLYAAGSVLIGTQAVGFSLLARTVATRAGLLPPSQRPRGRRRVSLEVGLVAGTVLLLVGLVGSVASVLAWSREEFGALDARAMLRLVIPSLTAMMLGLQVTLFAFFAGVIGLDMRHPSSGTADTPDRDRASAVC